MTDDERRLSEAAAMAANMGRTSPGLVLAVRGACEYTLWNRRELGMPVDSFDADLQAVVDAFEAAEAKAQQARQAIRERQNAAEARRQETIDRLEGRAT